MKIVLVNYRYFFSGGPERYMFNIKQLLEEHGHEVIPFSVKSKRNIPLDNPEYEKYFLDIVDDEVYFSDTKKTPKTVIKQLSRIFYSFEAKRKMKELIRAEKPDLVYILQMYSKISPSIVFAAKEENVPVVHRISDFHYMCPNSMFYNEKIGLCEDCLKGKRLSCLKYNCVFNSKGYSGIKMLEKLFHDKIGVARKIDQFVLPSEFTYEKMHEYGIPYEKLNHIPTFFNLKDLYPSVNYDNNGEPFVLYIGRIEKPKGLMTLVTAFLGLPYKLKIIGFSSEGYEDELKEFLGVKKGTSFYGSNGNIEFLGKKTFEEIEPYLKSCLCTIVPSEWYDNFPNSLIESYAFKKAVIATDLGSLQYMVKDGETGLKFKYKDIDDLRNKIHWIFEHQNEAKKMGENGFELVKTCYSPETHYDALIRLFTKVKNNNI